MIPPPPSPVFGTIPSLATGLMCPLTGTNTLYLTFSLSRIVPPPPLLAKTAFNWRGSVRQRFLAFMS